MYDYEVTRQDRMILGQRMIEWELEIFDCYTGYGVEYTYFTTRAQAAAHAYIRLGD